MSKYANTVWWIHTFTYGTPTSKIEIFFISQVHDSDRGIHNKSADKMVGSRANNKIENTT
jgi:hypothetical protein